MKNKNEESEKKSYESSKSENYEDMPMQNYSPCMYCPMMMYCSMMFGNADMHQMMPKYGVEGSEVQEEYRPYPGPGYGPGPVPGPGPGHGPGHNYGNLINQPVGVSLTNGQGVSGILCRVTNKEIYLLEYLYHTQFATKHYPLNQIKDIYRFPRCQNPGWVY